MSAELDDLVRAAKALDTDKFDHSDPCIESGSDPCICAFQKLVDIKTALNRYTLSRLKEAMNVKTPTP